MASLIIYLTHMSAVKIGQNTQSIYIPLMAAVSGALITACLRHIEQSSTEERAINAQCDKG